MSPNETRSTAPCWRIGDQIVDPALNEVRRGEATTHLEPTCVDLLVYLIEAAPRVVPAAELLERFWPTTHAEESTIHRRIARIRSALDDSARAPRYIETVPKRGYRVIATTARVEPGPLETLAGAQSANATTDAGPAAQDAGRDPTHAAAPPSTTADASQPAGMAARRRFASGAGLAVAAGVLLLLAAVLAIRWEKAADPTGDITGATRIAVLPFASFSANGNEAYLADGFQEDILTMLAGRGLEVISRTSTTRYAPPDSTASIAEIAAALDVSHVLEGSVRREGDALRIVVQLIEAPADRHLWAATYDRPMADMFAIQSEVSDAVADRLMATLEAAAPVPAEPAPTRDMDAYDQVLKARALLRSNTFANMKAAEALLEAARRSDPQLAVAHATLADTLLQQSLSGAEWPALRDRALAASDAALALDPDSAYAHRVRAHIDSVWQADLPSARAHYREAFRLAPDDPALLADFGAWLVIAEAEPERAVPLLRRALELDPLSPTVHYALVRALADTDRRAEAAAIVQRGLRFNPGNRALLDAQAALHFADGDLFDALEALRNLVAIDPERAELLRDLANLLAVIGADDAATRWIERLEALSPMHLFTFTARRTLLATQNDGDGLARLADRWDTMNSAQRTSIHRDGGSIEFGASTRAIARSVRADAAEVAGELDKATALRRSAVALTEPLLRDGAGAPLVTVESIYLALRHAMDLQRLDRDDDAHATLRALIDYNDSYNEAVSEVFIARLLLGEREIAYEFLRARSDAMLIQPLMDAVADNDMGRFAGVADDPGFRALYERIRARHRALRKRLHAELPTLMDASEGLPGATLATANDDLRKAGGIEDRPDSGPHAGSGRRTPRSLLSPLLSTTMPAPLRAHDSRARDSVPLAFVLVPSVQ